MWLRSICGLCVLVVGCEPGAVSGDEKDKSADPLIFTYRSLLQFTLSPPQVDQLSFSEGEQNAIIAGMLDARVSVPPIDDSLLEEGGFDRFLANMSLSAGIADKHFEKIWTTEISVPRQRRIIGSYLGSFGLRAFQNPALQKFFNLSKSQIAKLNQVLASAVEVDRMRWLRRDQQELPAKSMCMHIRLGLAERVLNKEQMRLLEDLVNDPGAQFAVSFTLGF